MKTGTVVIRKYGNRRLYDTSTSQYINLEDIAAMIRNGTDVQIVDVQTGADLTGATLTQIIAEDAKDKPSGLPLELLRQLIITTDHAGQEFITWYLKSAFDTYQQVQGSLKERLNQVGSAALSPLRTMTDFLHGSSPDKNAIPNSELAELRARVAELEASQNKARVASKPRKPAARKPAKKAARRSK
jgi:polyhydroxyalkanoate synthesis repressor PhaR